MMRSIRYDLHFLKNTYRLKSIRSYIDIQIQQNWNGHFAKIVNIDLGAIGAINPLVHHL